MTRASNVLDNHNIKMRLFKIDFSRHLPIYAALLLAVLLSACSSEQSARPNVVVFLVDDLGYMDIGANNPNSFYETPHIDGLAKSGMLFTDGYAANPVCSPTRYALMTGKHPTRVDATNFFPASAVANLIQLR